MKKLKMTSAELFALARSGIDETETLDATLSRTNQVALPVTYYFGVANTQRLDYLKSETA